MSRSSAAMLWRWLTFNVVFNILYRWASGQTIYDANSYYKPMTEDYEMRQRGNLFLPPCMKNLLNCWEVVRPDLVCKYREYYKMTLESICMDFRMQCREFTGPLPFKTLDLITWNYCADNVIEFSKVEYGPDAVGINI